MKKLDLIIQIFISVIVLCVIIGAIVLALSSLSPKNLCESLCDSKDGTYWIMSDCNGDTIACSGACNIGNETIYCKDILNDINSTI